MAAAIYVNQLEQWYGDLPDVVQSTFRPMFDQVKERRCCQSSVSSPPV
jgi:hypothetical protein